jgi:hypothetical protein
MLCFTIFFPFLARVFAPVVVFICKGKFSHLNEKAKNWLQYGFWVSFFDETYLFLMVCSGLNLRYYFEWIKGGDAVNSLISMSFGTILLVFPVFVAIFYRHKKN